MMYNSNWSPYTGNSNNIRPSIFKKTYNNWYFTELKFYKLGVLHFSKLEELFRDFLTFLKI